MAMTFDKRGPDYGTVLHSWLDEDIGAHGCYVTVFDDKQPMGKPVQKPYILRYVSTSLTVIDTAPD